MGHRHGLAGQYGKLESFKRFKGGLLVLLVVIVGGFGLMCWAAGYATARSGVWYGVGAMLVVLVPGLALERWADRELRRLAKARIQYLRGGQAEGLIAWLLELELDNRWHIFNGVMLSSHSDRDHVVVGPSGVFCISTKSRRGWFVGMPHGAQSGLLHNHRPCAFGEQALHQAMALRDRLAETLGAADVPWVQPVLATAFGWTDGDALGGKVWLTHAETLVDRIEAGVPSEKRPTRRQIERTLAAMTQLTSQ